MSKTIKNVFDYKLNFENLLSAHYRASIGKQLKKEVILFEMDLETNIIRILKEIKSGSYKFSNYRTFIIYEPKERIIKSLPYKDRIVHQWYVEEFIKPYFLPRFINDTYACLDNRGTHKAVKTTQKYMNKMSKNGKYFVLKCDIKKYFYSIDKNILYSILTKYISDNKLLEFTKIILDDKEEIGIPIGNYTSQFFANIYLNELDHYVKDVLKIKYYIRYMDDFILLVKTKYEAKNLKNNIEIFLKENLNLELNKKSKYFPNTLGINFCGYIIHEKYILIRKRSKKKIKKNIKKWNKLYENDLLDIKKVRLQFNSWVNHSRHANTYNLRIKLFNKILFKDEFIKMNVKI